MDDKEVSVILSIFVIIASMIGILFITSSGITGFSIFATTTIFKIGIGFIFIIIFLISMMFALGNLAYLESR